MVNQDDNSNKIFNEWNEEKKNIHVSEPKKTYSMNGKCGGALSGKT